MTDGRRMKTVIRKARIFLEMIKLKISFMATLSAFTGFVLAKQEASGELILILPGVFLLAGGASCLNQYQERRVDGLMERTRHRPLPSGRLRPGSALSMAACLIFSGLLLLQGTHEAASGLGLFAVLWYNGLYTRLKPKTAFAVLPGTLVGAVPPLIGWISGGGAFWSTGIWGIVFFLLIWQVPHSWILLHQFRADYENAGLPALSRVFSPRQVERIIFIWLLSTGASCLLIPLMITGHSYWVSCVLFVATLVFVCGTVRPFLSGHREVSKFSFAGLNLYVVLVLGLLPLDRLLISDPLAPDRILAMIVGR